MSREAKIEEEFYRLTKNILEKQSYVIEGLKFGDPEPQYQVDSGVADLMIPTHILKPLLITEFKRKIQTAGGLRVIRDTDPLGSKVITQALSYAVQCGASFFATTNGKIFALFTTPERGEPFRIDRHRLLVKEIELTETAVEEALRVVARWYQGIKVERTALDWTFIMRLRSFVEWLSVQIFPLVKERLKKDEKYKERYAQFSEEIGDTKPDAYAREAAYILMNKIVFYKILERYYGTIPILKPIPPASGDVFSAKLKEYFKKAVEVTKDFEPIFMAGFYDEAPLPSDVDALEEINAFVDDMETYKLEEVGSDVVGFIYERLIPEEERHQLGQFYTPPQIAELIVKWAVRESTDIVMDPACGSGTFLVKAYGRLRDLRSLGSNSVHKEILSRLYAIDINSFPTHITAMNLAMRDVRHPTSEMNVVVEDFFRVLPMQKMLVPYTIRTPKGEVRREISMPLVDAIVANPPYTRWTEIPDKTQEAIKKRLAETLTKYNLTARVQQGIEPGIYLHFIVWAHEFLRSGGRLGMIISDSWLQTDYGKDFGSFLLDHFRLRAIIDISARVFAIPMIGTCIILLEKESSQERRNQNDALFMYLDIPEGQSFDVDRIIKTIDNPLEFPSGWIVKTIRQGSIPRNQKWINFIFESQSILDTAKRSIQMKEIFEPYRGNISWSIWAIKHGKRPDSGCDAFFYLTKDEVEKWGLMPNWVHPCLTSPRYSKYYVLKEEDWKELKEGEKPCFVFIAHRPKHKLPKNVLEFIKWGEKTPLVKPKKRGVAPKTANKSLSSELREKSSNYYGWYDLGGVMPVSLFTVRRARYGNKFMFTTFPVALDEGAFISFVRLPETKFNEKQMKALLAYLNSSFVQLFVENQGIIAGGVAVIGLDVKSALELPCIDMRRISKKDLSNMAKLFDELESRARDIGGADTRENFVRLWDTIIKKIDFEVARIFQLPKSVVGTIRANVMALMERRLSRAEVARPEAIRGEEAPRIRPPKKTSRANSMEDRLTQPLERWLRT